MLQINLMLKLWLGISYKKTVTLSHKGTYHKTLLNEYRDWENIKLDEKKLLKLDQYLSSRRYGKMIDILSRKKSIFWHRKIFKKNKINTKKIVSIFTNVIGMLNYITNKIFLMIL